ncbi:MULTISPECIES: SRPBCC family protein [Kocuria]|uniref:SRPBCC family protein n=1 Tax=Kocuria TaxID=57493 RepID=UPI0006612252|nr:MULTISPECIES: SRPBCC family protein [Kocuria]MCT1366707.1 SRPBCC domain-containing protein [Rothia sp. p3-SID1597]RUQ22697.1 polyketide cyclase [Kocuria sp. HSID16901]
MSDTTSITVSRSIDAPAKAIFDLLSNPERHHEFDGSGFVVSDDRTDRIEKSGVKFTMNMNGEHMGGDYKTDNFVTGYDENKLIAWKTAPAGEEPPGWEWTWSLESTGSDSTDVTLTYDWSAMDPKFAQELGMPLVKQDQLEESLELLANAVSGA